MQTVSKLLFACALAVIAGIAAPAHALEFEYSYPAEHEIESRQITPEHQLNVVTTYYGETDSQAQPGQKLDAVIHFPSNGAALSAVSAHHVRKIAHMLLTDPAYKGTHITVNGYSDASGKDKVNQHLSYQRALTVMHALIADGVPAGMLSAQGFGKDSPIATNSTAEGRAENRRVTFTVTPAR